MEDVLFLREGGSFFSVTPRERANAEMESQHPRQGSGNGCHLAPSNSSKLPPLKPIAPAVHLPQPFNLQHLSGSNDNAQLNGAPRGLRAIAPSPLSHTHFNSVLDSPSQSIRAHTDVFDPTSALSHHANHSHDTLKCFSTGPYFTHTLQPRIISSYINTDPSTHRINARQIPTAYSSGGLVTFSAKISPHWTSTMPRQPPLQSLQMSNPSHHRPLTSTLIAGDGGNQEVDRGPPTSRLTDENWPITSATSNASRTLSSPRTRGYPLSSEEANLMEPAIRVLGPSDLQAIHKQAVILEDRCKRKAGQLSEHKAKRQRKSQPTRLRKGTEVYVEVPMDIWLHVLSFSPPRFLARARRINKAFNHALSYESAWRENRLQKYGPEMPGPPPGMKEWDYVNLLEGSGCMNCNNKKARKCYWAFLKRWCNSCFSEKVIKESAVVGIRTAYPRILECIPHGVIDSWGTYESAGFYSRTWQRSGHSRQRIFLGTDIPTIVSQLKDFLGPSGKDMESRTQDQIDNWYTCKENEASEHIKKVQEVEDWVEKRSRVEKKLAAHARTSRVEYFTARASELNPPISDAVLQLMPSFKRAVEIGRAPSERSWEILLPKLLNERLEAVKAEYQNRQARENLILLDQRRTRYEAMAEARATFSTPEQVRLLEVADRVLQKLQASGISDMDFVLVALREIRSSYYQDCRISGAENKFPRFRLLLDDAKTVYNLKISPMIDTWGDAKRIEVAKHLKCPGCTRTDVRRRFTFERLFCHIHEKHACHIGDFRRLREEALPYAHEFPWCSIDWPCNLPALAEHHTATGRWDPDDDRPYIRAPAPQKITGKKVSAFRGRSPSAVSGFPEGSFVDNVVYATRRLSKTSLGSEFKTQIAFEYGLRRMRGAVVGRSDFDVVRLLDKTLIACGLYDVFNHVKCGNCASSPISHRAKFASKAHSFGELLTHYANTHDIRHWENDLLQFPCDTELGQALEACTSVSGQDAVLASTVFNDLFPVDGA